MKGSAWWIVLGAAAIVAVATRQGVLLVFVLMLAAAAGVSQLWARFCLSNVHYRRRLGNSHLFYGEETSLTLEFVNAKPLPLAWLLVQDDIPHGVACLTAPLQPVTYRQTNRLSSLITLRWYERVTQSHRIQGTHRGLYRLGPARLESGDVFGFHRRRRTDDTVDTLVVYPKIVPLEALGLPAGRPMGEWLARRRIIEDPLRFAMVREYVPGDNPRFIHWKASARTGQLQTKLFEPSDSLAVVYAVDLQTMPLHYEFSPELLEFLLSAAASLIVRSLRERLMVGLSINNWSSGGTGWTHVRPSRHPAQMSELLSLLAGAGPLYGWAYARMLQRLLPLLPLGATVVALSAMPREDIYRGLARIEEAGHPTLLLSLGDTEPKVPASVRHHHLGGHDAWHRLEALELA